MECHKVNNLALAEKQRELCDVIQNHEEASRQNTKEISELQGKITKYKKLNNESRGGCNAIEDYTH